ncbi:dynein regulatory complex protein 12 [Aplochiton taeniatus]
MEHKLQSERLDRKDVSADLIRQYKTMQSELTSKVRRLDEEVTQLRQQLAPCQEELRTERRDREQMEKEKDAIIAELQNKLDNMETEYEKILHDTLDSLLSQLKETRLGWESRSTAIHQGYKDLLCDFGLIPLDI